MDIFYFRDPGYEYPPEPEVNFTKYKRNGNDDVENGDDDDDDDDNFNDSKSDSKNSKMHRKNNEMGAKFHIKAGEYQMRKASIQNQTILRSCRISLNS